MKRHKASAPRAGRMIAWTAAAALACWGATLAMVRAVAQQTAPPAAPSSVPAPDPASATPPTVPDGTAPAGDDDSNEEAPSDRARAPVTLDELPEFRDSADNNITLPVDI